MFDLTAKLIEFGIMLLLLLGDAVPASTRMPRPEEPLTIAMEEIIER